MNKFEEKYLAALDLGSAKIGFCVAQVQEGNIHIVHYQELPSEGIQTSAIYIPMLTAKAVRKAISEAEASLMIKISGAVVGLPRNDIAQVAASAALQRKDPEEYVSPEEIRAIKADALESYPLPDPDHQAIYGAIAQSFVMEDGMQLTEREIVGTLTPTIEGKFKVFVGRRQAVQSIDKIFKGTGVRVLKKYFLPEVMAKAALSKEEMKGGVALVDIGAGVTSIASRATSRPSAPWKKTSRRRSKDASAHASRTSSGRTATRSSRSASRTPTGRSPCGTSPRSSPPATAN